MIDVRDMDETQAGILKMIARHSPILSGKGQATSKLRRMFSPPMDSGLMVYHLRRLEEKGLIVRDSRTIPGRKYNPDKPHLSQGNYGISLAVDAKDLLFDESLPESGKPKPVEPEPEPKPVRKRRTPVRVGYATRLILNYLDAHGEIDGRGTVGERTAEKIGVPKPTMNSTLSRMVLDQEHNVEKFDHGQYRLKDWKPPSAPEPVVEPVPVQPVVVAVTPRREPAPMMTREPEPPVQDEMAERIILKAAEALRERQKMLESIDTYVDYAREVEIERDQLRAQVAELARQITMAGGGELATLRSNNDVLTNRVVEQDEEINRLKANIEVLRSTRVGGLGYTIGEVTKDKVDWGRLLDE